MGRTTSLGANWRDFVSTWFDGREPLIEGNRAWKALEVLQRLWPERLEKDLKEGAVHVQTVARLIDDAVTLAACEHLPGFDGVFDRVRLGQRGAACELRWAATLAQLGHEVTLEPELEGKHPDASILHEGEQVYFEVTSPEYSEAIRQVWDLTRSLAWRMAREEPPSLVSAYLTAEPGREVAETVMDFLRDLDRDALGTTHHLPGVGFVRCTEPGTEECDFDPATDSWMFAEVGVSAGTPKGGRADVRTRVTDERAQRFIDGEMHHFAVDYANVLVMDVSRVPRGIDTWPPSIGRRLQPVVNRRCGAVVVLDIWTASPPASVGLRSRLLKHPNPYRPVPVELAEQLRSLPNWWESPASLRVS
jgi:hypothetical protein